MFDFFNNSFSLDWLDNCCGCGYWTKRWNQLQSGAWIACKYMSLQRPSVECHKTTVITLASYKGQRPIN